MDSCLSDVSIETGHISLTHPYPSLTQEREYARFAGYACYMLRVICLVNKTLSTRGKFVT